MLVTWITRKRAAEILGCSTNTIDRLVAQGTLTPRADVTWRGGRPSLDPDQVRRVAGQRAAEEAEADRRRREREAGRVLPPNDQHEWLTAGEAARIMEVSVQTVFKRTRKGTLPYVVGSNGRRWYRSDLIEATARAGRAARTREVRLCVD